MAIHFIYVFKVYGEIVFKYCCKFLNSILEICMDILTSSRELFKAIVLPKACKKQFLSEDEGMLKGLSYLVWTVSLFDLKSTEVPGIGVGVQQDPNCTYVQSLCS